MAVSVGNDQRALRLAVNRLGEKGEWNLDELRIEFEELILADAPIEITGFTLDEVDQIVLGEADEAVEQGPLAPEANAIAVGRRPADGSLRRNMSDEPKNRRRSARR